MYGPEDHGNVVGGAYASITGGGENTTYAAVPGSARFEQPRLIGRLIGGGNNAQVVYTAPQQPDGTLTATARPVAGPRG